MDVGTALVTIFTSALTALVTLRVAGRNAETANKKNNLDRELAERRADVERELLQLKSKIDQELAVHRARLENPHRVALEAALRVLFSDPRFPRRHRSFRRIKQAVSGFTDEEVRRQLHAIGARPLTLNGGEEGWHLPQPENKEEE